MKKLLLFFNSLILTICPTVGLSNFFQQEKIWKINTVKNKEEIEKERMLSTSEQVYNFVVKHYLLERYGNEYIFRIYSTPELKLMTFNDITKAIEKKLFILTEGQNIEVHVLDEKNEILTESINKKQNVFVKLPVNTSFANITFNLLINLEQSSDLQQLIAIRYLLEKPNVLISFLPWQPILENKILTKKENESLKLQFDQAYLRPVANILDSALIATYNGLPINDQQKAHMIEIPGLENPSLFLQNFVLNSRLQRRNLLHEQWYYFLLESIKNKIDVPNFLADLYTKEFNNYDEVIVYINNEFKKSVWTKDMEVSWNKRFVPNNFFSTNTRMERVAMQILNFINLDLKLNDSKSVKVTLTNLQSKTKINNDINTNFSVIEAFNNILCFLSFEYINTLETQQELAKFLNAVLSKTIQHRHDENPNEWLTEILAYLSYDPNLSDSEIREILLSKLCNTEISRNFVLLRNNDEDSNLIEGENILHLRIFPNEDATEDDLIDYDLLVNWSVEKEKYHYQHEILYKYIVDLENEVWKIENTNNLTVRNKQSDLKQTIKDDIESYYQIKKNDEIAYFLDENRVRFCKKDIFLMCFKNSFFEPNLQAPIKFLNPDILLGKGNNNILVEVLLDNYSQKICYSIEI